jgi:HEPN domain-containing protein
MSERPEPAREFLRWVEKADHDLLAAEHDMELAEQGLTDIVCFHCQQCAEKYLKALLLFRGVAFPRTHDLRLLWDLVPCDVSLGIGPEKAVPLNRYVIEALYPGNWEPIAVPEALQALAMAKAVREAVRRQLPLTGAGGNGR